MELGQKIKEVRTNLNRSQQELAEITGLTSRTIQRIENNEVKPSLHSLKMIGKALDYDFSEMEKQTDSKPYEINFTIKITDMNQLINDLKTLLKNNWKILLLIVLVVFLITNYSEIKSGIIDGWNNK
jgi:transcriptional regulator with XRE-family HTH domain